MSQKATDKGLLGHPLTALQLSSRARQACERIGVCTISHFLITPRSSFLSVPGCGDRTYDELEAKVREWLARSLGDAQAGLDLRRPLRPLVDQQPVASALERLRLETVGDFLSLPRELGKKALGSTSWQLVLTAIERTRRLPPATAPLLPDSLQRMRLGSAALPARLQQQLEDFGCTTVGHALTLPAGLFEEGRELGPDAAATFRASLDQLLRSTLEQLDTTGANPALDWPTLRGRLLAPLEEVDRDWLCQRIGIGLAGRPLLHTEKPDNAADEITRDRDAAVRDRVVARAPTLHGQLHEEVLRELDALDGIVRADCLAVGSLLRTAAKGSGDPMLPLRLVAFLWPDQLHLHENCLTTLSPRTTNRLLRELRILTTPRLLPRPLEEVERHLQAIADPVPRGLLLLLLTDKCHLRVHTDPARGELLLPQQRAPSSRLAELLHEEGRPTSLDDLVFHYRERFRSAQRHRLLSRLRRDATFLEIAPDVWSLRTWHQDELAAARPLAEQVLDRVVERGGKQHVATLIPESDTRTSQLVLDLVRRDPRVRYLGRGEVCATTHSCSAVLAQLLQDFKRAAGEVPLARFVDNQPRERRRLVQRLLNENRLFLLPSPDRIDVLTNYPFGTQRLQRLTDIVDSFLTAQNGYAALDAVLDEVNRCELGGSWMHPTLLGELLRRHGPFEILPGGYVARAKLGLGGWVMRRARNALREATVPITVKELLVERPELTEFVDCLENLLHKDPLVQTEDGSRFQIA